MERSKSYKVWISIIIIVGIIVTLIFMISKFVDTNKTEKAQNQVKHAPVLGKKDAKNTIVIYADFSCPHCREFDHAMFDELKREYVDSGKANIRFVNGGLLGDDSVYKNVAAYAVYEHAPDKYWDFNRKLFEEQTQKSQGKAEDKISLKNTNVSQKQVDSVLSNVSEVKHVNSILKDIDLSNADIERIQADLKNANSNAWKNIMKDRKIMNDNTIKTVPSVYVNGKQIQSPTQFQEYDKIIK